MMDSYLLALMIIGLLMVTAAWIPRALKGSLLAYPLLYLGAGWLFFSLWPQAGSPGPFENPLLSERLCELAVLLALAGAGLRLDTRFDWRVWGIPWRLLGITMPLSIAAIAGGGWLWLGLSPAAALLLGAALAPTDPVLAGDIQVAPPREGDQNQVRFSLTTEASLNDGLAFPFVYLALALAAGSTAPGLLLGNWLLLDVCWRIGLGLLCGLGLGHLLGWLVFRLPGRIRISESREGFFALALTLLVYGLTELLEGYGFVSVFVAAMALRRAEHSHVFHSHLHAFTEQIERVLLVTLLFCFGGALAQGLLDALSWQGALLGLATLLLVRPLSGLIGLAGASCHRFECALIAFLGIRGLGSFYYLAYAMNHGDWAEMPQLWSIVAFTVLASILIHGSLGPLLLRRLEGEPEAGPVADQAESLATGRSGQSAPVPVGSRKS